MAEIYRIGEERLRGIGDQVRHLSNSSGKMTPAEMEKTLAGLSRRNKSVINKIQDIEPRVEIIGIPQAARYYYNGVLLPAVPQEMLANYPYCFIRERSANGLYDLMLTKSSPKYKVLSDGRPAMVVYDYNINGTQWYQLPMAGSATADSWIYYERNTSIGSYILTDARIVWTNRTIISSDGTVYLHWSMPEPKED